jgi:hypothetical protein
MRQTGWFVPDGKTQFTEQGDKKDNNDDRQNRIDFFYSVATIAQPKGF